MEKTHEKKATSRKGSKKDKDWIVIKYDEDPNVMICERCGVKQKMPEGPVLINVYLAMLSAFGKDHAKCKEPSTNNY